MPLEVIPQAFDLAELVVPTTGRSRSVVMVHTTGCTFAEVRPLLAWIALSRTHGVIVLVEVRIRVGGVDHVLVVDHYADAATTVLLLLARILERHGKVED